MITPEEKQTAMALFNERNSLIEKRCHNQDQVKILRSNCRTEKDLDNRHEMRKSIRAGIELIADQSRRIASLSRNKIANKVGVTPAMIRNIDNLINGYL